jgi:hypothetical protein
MFYSTGYSHSFQGLYGKSTGGGPGSGTTNGNGSGTSNGVHPPPHVTVHVDPHYPNPNPATQNPGIPSKQHPPNVFSPAPSHPHHIQHQHQHGSANHYQTQISIEDQGIDMTQVNTMSSRNRNYIEHKQELLLMGGRAGGDVKISR